MEAAARPDPQARPHAPHWVTSDDDATALAQRILDPERDGVIVGLSTQPYLSRPMLDPDAVLAALPSDAEVWVITRSSHAWRLTEALPPGLDVYGGAARLWWPMPDAAAQHDRDHPVFTIFSPDDAARVTREIGTRAKGSEATEPPPPDTTMDAIVSQVFGAGAELTLASGHRAWASNPHLAIGRVYDASEAVRPGQQVRVRVSDAISERGAIMVSLKPFCPDPWARLAEVYEPGMVIEGVVVGWREFGAFVELIPGAEGLLPIRRVAAEFVRDIGDHLSEDDRIAVKLLSLDSIAQRAELSLVDVPTDAVAQPPISIYPGGPPWLPAPEPDARAAPDAPDDTAEIDEPRAVPIAEPSWTEPDEENESEPSEPARPGPAPSTELGDLTAAIADGASVRDDLAAVTAEAERDLARLRADARTLASELRDEIDAAQLRVLRLGHDEAAALVSSTRQQLDVARRVVNELRERLASAERDREALIRQAQAARAQVEAGAKAAASARADAQAAQSESAELRAQLDSVDGGDPERRFLRELHHAWTTSYAADADRTRYPFTAPLVGPAFLSSLDTVKGVSRERVLEVCAHVVTGRAAEIAGLEVHQLRSSAGGGTPTLVREDGATAWRVSLQANRPAARRLHYWQLRDGRIELSKIGLHDDLTIA